MIIDQALPISVHEPNFVQSAEMMRKQIVHAGSTTSITDNSKATIYGESERSVKIYRIWNKQDEFLAFSTASGILKLHMIDGSPKFTPVTFRSSYPLVSAAFTNSSVVVLASTTRYCW